MSQLGKKTGVIFAVVALALGVTAGTALGWANEQPESGSDYGNNQQEHGNKGKEHGNKGKEEHGEEHGEENNNSEEHNYGQTPPPVQTPTVQQPQTPAPPVVQQGTPSQPPQQPSRPETTPTETQSTPESPVVAQQSPTAAPAAAPLAPAAERTELAQTGLDPGLMALLGALCLGGGAFFFRRALVRG
jgi:LPXTG-motif cell wall-anchored protein